MLQAPSFLGVRRAVFLTGLRHDATPGTTRSSVLALYGVTAILALLLAVSRHHLWKADLHIPMVYGHDASIVHMWVKSIIDNPWAFTNEYLGAPGTLEMQDFPVCSNVHFLFIKGMAVFTHDPFLIVNWYYLLSFPMIACTFLFLMRSLGVRAFPALVFSIAYCFLPGHFKRGTCHLFLATYFMIPLFTCMVAWLLVDDRYLVYRREATGKLAINWSSRKTWVTLFSCVALGSDFPYYPLFAVILCPFAAGMAIYLEKSRRAAFASLMLLGLLSGSFAANLAPTFLYHVKNGSNPSGLHVTNHPWTDTEIYAMKLARLLLPTDHHVLGSFRAVHDEYYAKTNTSTDLNVMALGTVASLGFLGVLLRLLTPDLTSARGRVYYLLGVLTVVAFLFGSVGGFGTLMNLLWIKTSRTYDRISMFIACFALVALALWFDGLIERLRTRRGLRFLPHAILAGLLVVACGENSRGALTPPSEGIAAELRRDAAFVREVEASVPPGSKIFQLPYVSFLSYINVQHKMMPYDHFRGYLHSKTLRWSFGAMHGRPTDQFHAHLTTLPLPDRVEALVALGFAGIYLDRFGYADEKFEARLAALLAVEPITSGDGRLAFYSLAPRAALLRSLFSEEELRHRYDRLLEIPALTWGKGCDAEEKDGAGNRWRWCRSEASMKVVNFSSRPVRKTLRIAARAYDAQGGELLLSGPLIEDRIVLPNAGVKFSREIDIPPGSHRIDFSCTAKPYVHPSRTLVFVFTECEFVADPPAK